MEKAKVDVARVTTVVVVWGYYGEMKIADPLERCLYGMIA